jgi:hypothetical protein
MAQGDLGVFDQNLVDFLEKLHDFENDVFKVGIVTSTTTPTTTTADPRWGAGGTTNFKTNEVTPGGTYAVDGATIANPAVTLTGGLAQFDGDDVSWAQNAGNPTNAFWGIIYNSTDAGLRCVGWVDLGGTFDMTTGPLSITWHANGLFRVNQA